MEEVAMDQKQIAKQMIQFNKTAFDNGYKAMSMLYEQNEKVTGVFMDQASWIPEDSKKAVKDWMQTYKNGCEDFKQMVDENFSKAESYFTQV